MFLHLEPGLNALGLLPVHSDSAITAAVKAMAEVVRIVCKWSAQGG